MARGHTVIGLWLFAACACGRTETRSGFEADEPLAVQPTRLVFPPTPIGRHSTKEIELSAGGSSESVELLASPPFWVGPGLRIFRGSSAFEEVTFSPTRAGPVQGTLVISAERSGQLGVTLEGEGLYDCGPGCNDGNACTLDLCDEQQGCFHEPVTCPAAASVCEFSECHAALGCRIVAKPDGTPCGMTTCGGTSVCRAGECVEGGRTRLVGHWTFDEMDGTTIFDSSGRGHHGGLVAGTRVPSRRNRGITHSDGSLLVEIMDHPDFAFAGSFTVEVWIEPPDPLEVGQQQVIVFRGDAREGLDPFVFSMQPTGARFLVESELGGMFVAPSTQVPPRTFVKLTGVFDADALEVRVYRDCALAETECTTFTSAIRELNAGSNPGVGLGGHASHGGSINSFRGVLDEVRMYEGAMTSADVASTCE